MLIFEPGTKVVDGFTTLELGIDSGKAASLIGPNQGAYAINITFRGGYPTTRPGWTTREDRWSSSDARSAFRAGKFQGASSFHPDFGNDELFASVSGRLYRFQWGSNNRWVGSDVTPLTDPNPSILPKAYFQQAENYLVVQDGLSSALIWGSGGTFRRAGPTQVPTGEEMAYVLGRLWVSKGAEYVAGDIVGGPSGSSATNYRDSVLYFTENTYLAEGGAFSVGGEVTAITSMADIDTATGDGFLVISTRDRIFSNRVPMKREDWKNFTDPVQRVLQINFGALSDESIVPVNGDLYYRAQDGIRSLRTAVLRFNEPGNTPISNEVNRPLNSDAQRLLGNCSGVLFDNRLMTLCSPFQSSQGVAWRGCSVLDFDLVTSIRNKLAPAWEGVWNSNSLGIFRMLTARINGVERLFAFTLGVEGIQIQELVLSATTDDGDDITWSLEGPSLKFASPLSIKELDFADLWFDRINGTVQLSAYYRPDQYPGWVSWTSWQECTTTTNCTPVSSCVPLQNLKEGYMARRRLPTPEDTCNTYAGRPYRQAYEFQAKIAGSGFARLRSLRLFATTKMDVPVGDCPPSEALCQELNVCAGEDI